MTRPWCCALLLVGMGCSPAVDKPTPPDLSPLVALYDSPTGTFDQAVVAQLQEDLAQALAEQEAMRLAEQLDALFGALGGEEPSSTTQAEVEVNEDNTIRIEGEGFLEVTRICDGWGDEPVADPSHGHLSLNVNVTDVSVDPVLWATAESCQSRSGDDEIELRAGRRQDVGDLRIFVGNQLTLGDLQAAPILVEVDASGSFDAGATFEALAFDLRLLPEEQTFEVRIEVSDGSVIVRTVDDEILVVRARNGTFACTDGSCRSDAGQVVNLF